MVKIILVAFIIIPFTLLSAKAQEVVSPLLTNPALQQSQQAPTTKSGHSSALVLPFKDDFSHSGPFPDSRLWEDNYVFINKSFALHPKTVGTATFDLLNQHGEIYPHASINPYQFEADKLTSRRIRLDSIFTPQPIPLTPADSILLTFYYQPQGKGSAPRERDTLLLEFLRTPGHYIDNPDDPANPIWINDEWVGIWKSTGRQLSEFVENNNGAYFRRVAIKIEDPLYLRNDFQFRFRSYGSFPFTKTPSNFAGNTSIWNIDYVTLDYGRSKNNPFYYDIAFTQPAQSILRSYHSMPWSHFIANPQRHLRSNFNLSISNLDNQTYNYSYTYFIRNQQGQNIRNYFGGTWNIAPFHLQGYQNYPLHTNPIVVPNPLIPLTAAEGNRFQIVHVVRLGTQGDNIPRNDTIAFNQVFDNYFAYDDGIPESGYGLVGFNPKGAVRFILGHTDQITAVQMYFNPTLNNQNRNNFYLRIWKDLEPEVVLYESELLSTDFLPGTNQFITYHLSEPLEVSDTIYVGWRQTTSEFLNIGFDLNNNARENLFYNTHGEWLTSVIDGALMLRPVFGESIFTNLPQQPNTQTQTLNIFPNPVTQNYFRIEWENLEFKDYTIEIYDSSGRLVLNDQNLSEIHVGTLQNGLYFLRLKTDNQTHTGKFLITR